MNSRPEIFLIDDDPCALMLSKKIINRLLPRGYTRLFSSARMALDCLRGEDDHHPHGRRPGPDLHSRPDLHPRPDLHSRPGLCLCPGLILTDLHMPDMDGYEFLDAFEGLPQAIRHRFTVFVLSSTTDKSEIQRLFEKPGFGGFCSKPLTEDKLRYILNQVGLGT